MMVLPIEELQKAAKAEAGRDRAYDMFCLALIAGIFLACMWMAAISI